MYHLSKRQKKVLKRGSTLQIALPHPPGDEIHEPLAWARSQLDSADIIEAEIIMVGVDPCNGVEGTLSEDIGVIVSPEQYADHPLLLHVECVMCTLRTTGQPHDSTYLAQWPKSHD